MLQASALWCGAFAAVQHSWYLSTACLAVMCNMAQHTGRALNCDAMHLVLGLCVLGLHL